MLPKNFYGVHGTTTKTPLKNMEPLIRGEENYLRALFKICEKVDKPANTNAIAEELGTSAAAVSDMLRRLSGKVKDLGHYKPHRGVVLTKQGRSPATMLVRKHRPAGSLPARCIKIFLG